ncbi:MAG: L,D-transpeptidase family protein [Clostridia bacterium]
MLTIITLFLVGCSPSSWETEGEHPTPHPSLAPTASNRQESDKSMEDEKGEGEGQRDIQNDLEASQEDELFFQEPERAPKKVLVEVYKGRRILELYGDGILMGRFRISLGKAPEGTKEREGDHKTPEGDYYVCTRNPQSAYYLSLGLSYPNVKDAERGLEAGLIDEDTYKQIKEAQEKMEMPPWYTPLGGEICIHGGGIEGDWTEGCIAVDNEVMDILWKYISLKTPVRIRK